MALYKVFHGLLESISQHGYIWGNSRWKNSMDGYGDVLKNLYHKWKNGGDK